MNQKLSAFLESGIFRFEDSDSVFIDPVRVHNQLYPRFMVSPSSYYSRFFESSDETHQQSSNSRKRKRKEKKPYTLNESERAADWRHQVKIFYTIPCLVNGDSEVSFGFWTVGVCSFVLGREAFSVEGKRVSADCD